jgi:hypothetical protein
MSHLIRFDMETAQSPKLQYSLETIVMPELLTETAAASLISR